MRQISLRNDYRNLRGLFEGIQRRKKNFWAFPDNSGSVTMKNTFTYHKSTSSVSLQGAHTVTHTRILDSTCLCVGLQNESVAYFFYFFLQQCLFTSHNGLKETINFSRNSIRYTPPFKRKEKRVIFTTRRHCHFDHFNLSCRQRIHCKLSTR